MPNAAESPSDAWGALKAFAQLLAERDTRELASDGLRHLQPQISELVERGVLAEDRGYVRFFHENLFDHVLARTFAEEGTPLADWLSSRQQDLTERADVRRILTYQRGVARETYTANVATLLERDDIRFLIKDAVFAVMREDTSPAQADWHALERFVLDADALEHPAALSVTWEMPWFDLLDELGVTLRWLASDVSEAQDRATTLLQRAAAERPKRVASLLTPFVGRREWDRRIRWVLRFSEVAASRETFEFLRNAVVESVFDDNGAVSPQLWITTHDLPARQPAWAAELLSVIVNRERQTGGPSSTWLERAFGEDDYWSPRWLATLSSEHPRAYANVMLPLLVEGLRDSDTPLDDDGVRRDEVWPRPSYSETRNVRADEAPFTALDRAMRRLAKRSPQSLRRLSRSLMPLLEYETARLLLYGAWAANPRTHAGEALAALLGSDPPPFRAGYVNDPFWAMRELIRAIQPYADDKRLKALERRVRSYWTAWERSADGRDSRGLAQFELLDSFDEARLSRSGVRTLNELRRKFGDTAPEPLGIMTGFVGPPISSESAAKMSDDQWLKAIERYKSENSTAWLRGGAIEFSRVLEEEVKQAPSRFAALAMQFTEATSPHYVDAVLRGLGDTDEDLDPEIVFSVIRHFFELPARPGGRWMVRPLRLVARQPVPTDILEITAWYATEDPDPEAELWRSDNEPVYYGGDPYTAGINSVRGTAAEALSVLIWPDSTRLDVLRPALASLVSDESVAVRTCAAGTLASTYRHEPAYAIELFSTLVATHDILLATPLVERFISISAPKHLSTIGPTIARMIASSESSVRQAGGRQAALARLSTMDALELSDRALAGDESTRLGVAEVATANVSNAEVREPCLEWLVRLFDDPSEQVRGRTATWCAALETSDLRELYDLAAVYVETQAHAEDQVWLLRALDETTIPVTPIALRAVERFLELQPESDDLAFGAVEAPMVARLAVRAYTSAVDASQRARALDMIEQLLAARVSDIAAFVAQPV